MKLTDSQFQALKDRLAEDGDMVCLRCGSAEIAIGETLVALAGYEEGGHVRTDAAAPLVALTCMTCAHTSFFSALVLGLDS